MMNIVSDNILKGGTMTKCIIIVISCIIAIVYTEPKQR